MRLKIAKKELIVFSFVLVVYLCIAIITGLHHEPWADEAQSWLISRDNDVWGIFQAVRYEGTLPAWHYILKFFQVLGLPYNCVFIIPIIFTTIGIILLFLTDAPFLCKILLPFSFYVMYQESIIARQYCLIFPSMMLLVLAYRKRRNKPAMFFLSLIVISMTSSYGLIISCSFMLWELIILIKNHFRSSKEHNELGSSRFHLFFWIAAIILVLSIIILIPPSDCSFRTVSNDNPIISITGAFYKLVDNTISGVVFLIIFIVSLILYFRKHICQALVYTVPLILYMVLFYHQTWHLAYLFFLVVSIMLIFIERPASEANNKEKALHYILGTYFYSLLIIQCAAGFYGAYLELKYPYSPSKDVAEYIKPYVESGASVDNLGYHTVSVQPYFDSNLFSNNPSDKSYYIWSDKYTYDELSSPSADIIIAPYNVYDNPEDQYDMITFNSFVVYKFSLLRGNSMSVYIKKDLNLNNS